MSSSAVRAVVAGHGDLAAGLISAVGSITGRADALLPLTNLGLGAEQIEERLREALADGVRVIFTDLPAGSWTIAARRLMRTRPDLVLVTGVNLATLLDFVLRDDSAEEAARHAVEKGRAAMLVSGATRGA